MPDHSPEPWDDETATLIPAGDERLLFAGDLSVAGKPPKVACRVLCEENYQRAKACVNFCRGVGIKDLNGNLGVFVEAKLDARRRFHTPEISNAIALLKNT